MNADDTINQTLDLVARAGGSYYNSGTKGLNQTLKLWE
jgi:hypothetical protein